MATASQSTKLPLTDAASRIEVWIERFEVAWHAGRRPDIDDYLPADQGSREAALRELIHTDLEYRLRSGEPTRVEAYLQRYPHLAGDRGVVLELIATEFEQRRRLVGPTVEEYLARFPEFRIELAMAQEPCPPWVKWIGHPRTAPTRQSESDLSLEKAPSRLGRFQLQEKVGSGGFGTVYRAWDCQLRRTVALKVPRAGSQAAPEEVQRLLKEARNAAQLKHPGIVALYEAGQIDGTCYVASEFVRGQALSQRCAGGPLSAREAAAIVADVAEAVDYAHGQGVIHRDIKPANILLDWQGRRHLADFGLAKRQDGGSSATLEGQLLGTPAYMSPEQARGGTAGIDARSDIYSLGVVLYQVLTGELPFRGNNQALLLQVLEEEPLPPRRLKCDVPRDLENVCLRTLSKEPGRRYPTAAALAEDLRRFLAGRPVQARPVGQVDKLWRWCRRKPLVASLLLVLALVLVAATGMSVVLWQRAEDSREQAERQWQRAEKEWQNTERERARAEANFRQAFQAVSSMTKMGLPQSAWPPLVRNRLLHATLGYYQEFIKQQSGNLEIQKALATAYTELGNIHRELSRPAQARQFYEEAVTRWRQLSEEHPESVPRYSNDLVAGIYYQLGEICLQDEKPTDAVGYYQLALSREEKLTKGRTPQHEWLGMVHEGLGKARRRQGQLDQAVASYQKAQHLLEQALSTRGLQSVRLNEFNLRLSDLYREAGKTDEAFQVVHRVQQSLNDELNKNVPPHRFDFSLNADTWEALRNTAKEITEALEKHQCGQVYELLVSFQQLLARLAKEADVFGTRAQEDLVKSAEMLNALQVAAERPLSALSTALDQQERLRKLVQANPHPRRFRASLADNLVTVGQLQRQLGKRAEALRSCDEAYKIAKQLLLEWDDEDARKGLAMSRLVLGMLHEDSGQADSALEYYEKAFYDYNRLAKESRRNMSRWNAVMAVTCQRLGDAQPERRPSSTYWHAQALSFCTAVCDWEPGNRDAQADRIQCYWKLGESNLRSGNRPGAATWFEEGIKQATAIRTLIILPNWHRILTCELEMKLSLIRLHREEGQLDKALQTVRDYSKPGSSTVSPPDFRPATITGWRLRWRCARAKWARGKLN